MSIEDQLRAEADRIADGAGALIGNLESQITAKKAELSDLRDRLGSAKGMKDRARTFEPKVGNDYRCPDCWTESGSRSMLVPIPSDSDDYDRFRCDGPARHEVTIAAA